MIDFELSEDQKMLKRTAHEFAKNEIRPLAAEVDLDPDPDAALRTKDNIIKQLRLGFGEILIPEEYGGSGGSLLDLAILIEELCWGDRGLGISTIPNNMFGLALINVGTDGQREKWMPYIVGEKSGVVGGCISEPTGGSEIFCPLPNPELGVRTTAVRDGDYYVVNGEKCFSSGIKMAEIAFVMARTDKTKSSREGSSLFIARTDTPGFNIGKAENKMGCRSTHNCEVTFDNMRIPVEDMLGGEEGVMPTESGEVALGGAQAVGLARAVYEEALAYARDRVIWGKPIIEYEGIYTKLVDMAAKIIAMRALTWQLCWAGANPDKAEGLDKLVRLGKLYPTGLIRGIMADAIQIFGGYGYMKPTLIEKVLRDAQLLPIAGTPNEIHTYFVAQKLY